MSLPVTLRPATADDAPGMAAILSDWFEHTPFVPRLHTAKQDLAFCRSMVAEGGVTIAALSGVAGYMALSGDVVCHLFVRADLRRFGVGKRLLDLAKEGRSSLHLWCFQANTGARAFYEREGFRAVARTPGDNEEKLPDVKYLWEATP